MVQELHNHLLVAKYIFQSNHLIDDAECLNFKKFYICFSDHVPLSKADIDVYQDGKVHASDSYYQSNAPWHLHYVQQKSRQSPWCFIYDKPISDQKPVYVMDTWMDVEHSEFEGRASRGGVFATGTGDSHGTHVGGLVGSKSYGTSKSAFIVSVQVLDGNGFGSWSQILKGLHWIMGNPVGIINMSISGGKTPVMDSVIAQMTELGFKFVVAAGNNNKDACEFSPASNPNVLTVGATNRKDSLASFSNYGKCIDILAPGEDILSLYPQQRLAYMSGTSMASPLVAGIWANNFSLTKEELISNSLTNSTFYLRGKTPRKFIFEWNKPAC